MTKDDDELPDGRHAIPGIDISGFWAKPKTTTQSFAVKKVAACANYAPHRTYT